MQETTLEASDERDLKVLEAGAPDGFPVFVHHGTPASRLLYSGAVADATERGIRLISHDRPGYGGSTPRPGRSIADVVEDVVTIADALGIERFASWGISGGGPHVLACAALLPERCVAAASLASLAPYPAEGLDQFAGMGEDNIEEFRLSLSGGEELRRRHEQQRAELASADPSDFVASLKTLLTPVDEAVLTGEAASYLVAWMNEGVRPGVEGWLEDDLAFVRPWGFDLSDITTPVLLWQGHQDRFVPFGHGEWLASQIPNVEAHLEDEEGHLTLLVNRVPDTHEWLLGHA